MIAIDIYGGKEYSVLLEEDPLLLPHAEGLDQFEWYYILLEYNFFIELSL